MFDSVNVVLLLAGFARVATWAAIAIIGWKQRRLGVIVTGPTLRAPDRRGLRGWYW